MYNFVSNVLLYILRYSARIFSSLRNILKVKSHKQWVMWLPVLKLKVKGQYARFTPALVLSLNVVCGAGTPEHSGVLFRVFIRIAVPAVYSIVFLKDATLKKKGSKPRKGTFLYQTELERVLSHHFCIFVPVPCLDILPCHQLSKKSYRDYWTRKT